MFGFFSNRRKKAAKDLIGTAYKVYNYRCDIIAEADAKSLSSMIEQAEELIGDGKLESKEYAVVSEKLEKLMRKCGGAIYPLTAWADYTDMIIVAGILAIGIRSFFLQPFKIPTNSMYPSFYGMTSEVYGANADSRPPSLPEKVFRFAAFGASNYELKAPCDGDVYIEINPPDGMRRAGIFASETRPVRKFFVWPTFEKYYTFLAGGEEIELALPADFSIEETISKAFDIKDFQPVEKNGRYFVKLCAGKAGQTFLNFDILGGDMLFVDRFTYNFKKPAIGDAIVFRTKYCDGMTELNGGIPDDKYYIKRLVGQGGDSLYVKDYTLYRNGTPIEGSSAFAANAKREGLYSGYRQDGSMKDGAQIKISPRHYFAMGDNSANSLDSRYWGEVPENALVGKSLIIFYPFTSRWGASK